MATFDTSSPLTSTNGVNERKEHAAGMHGSIEKLADAARPAADRLANAAQQAIDKAVVVATEASDKLSATSEQIQDLRQRAMEAARTQVRNKPMVAVGIALAAGFVLSRALRQQR